MLKRAVVGALRLKIFQGQFFISALNVEPFFASNPGNNKIPSFALFKIFIPEFIFPVMMLILGLTPSGRFETKSPFINLIPFIRTSSMAS